MERRRAFRQRFAQGRRGPGERPGTGLLGIAGVSGTAAISADLPRRGATLGRPRRQPLGQRQRRRSPTAASTGSISPRLPADARRPGANARRQHRLHPASPATLALAEGRSATDDLRAEGRGLCARPRRQGRAARGPTIEARGVLALARRAAPRGAVPGQRAPGMRRELQPDLGGPLPALTPDGRRRPLRRVPATAEGQASGPTNAALWPDRTWACPRPDHSHSLSRRNRRSHEDQRPLLPRQSLAAIRSRRRPLAAPEQVRERDHLPRRRPQRRRRGRPRRGGYLPRGDLRRDRHQQGRPADPAGGRRAARARQGQRRPRRSRRRSPRTREELLAKLDLAKPEGVPRTSISTANGALFAKADADKDGKLSPRRIRGDHRRLRRAPAEIGAEAAAGGLSRRRRRAAPPARARPRGAW